ncbi:hypothetical protein OUZ56_008228 [Daphnia magna]|uniref:Uncharacterized protein n=1 Tax=Daphnia magna TaxID=35525 RepID=A0ABR0ACR6_9CRUS|nr:hypothetical protein OUZ56_008228 [Daphnia magna]
MKGMARAKKKPRLQGPHRETSTKHYVSSKDFNSLVLLSARIRSSLGLATAHLSRPRHSKDGKAEYAWKVLLKSDNLVHIIPMRLVAGEK